MLYRIVTTFVMLSIVFIDRSPAQIKIMPLGNSITYDNNITDIRPQNDATRVAYRQKLYEQLDQSGYNFEFAGSEIAGEPTVPNGSNAGFPGITAAELEYLLETGIIDQDLPFNVAYSKGFAVTAGPYLDAFNPDVILLHIGTNDVVNTTDLQIAAILDEIDAYESRAGKTVPVFLALIIQETPSNPAIQTLNEAVQTMAIDRITNGDEIVIVDMENSAGLTYALDPAGDMTDAVHPNTTGYEKMGTYWYNQINSYYTLPSITSAGGTQAYISQPYQYQVGVNADPEVTFTLVNGPGGMTIDGSTGLVEWTPSISQTGDFTIEIKAESMIGMDTETFILNVSNSSLCITDIVNYWKLNETSGSEYTELNEENANCVTCPTPGIGIIDGGQLFDLTSEVNVPNQGNWNWGSIDSFTLEVWINTSSSTSGNRVVVGRDRNSNFPNLHFWLGLDDSGTARFVLFDNNNLIGDVGEGIGSPLNDGNWHHLVAIRDGAENKNKLYVDGVLVDEVSVNYTGSFESDVDLNIGHLSNGFHFEGFADELLIYNRSLDLAEISDHYQNGLLGNEYCNIPPAINSTAVTAITVGQEYSYDVDAIAIPFPAYSLVTAPTGMTIDSQTGLINWIPAIGQEGAIAVEVRATNVNGNSTQSFSIQVAELPDCFTGLTHYWKFEDATTNSFFDSFGDSDATCSSCPSVTTGVIGQAQNFNLNTELNINDDGTFDWGTDDSFSVELWFNTSGSTSGNRVLIGRDDSSTDLHFWVGLEDSGRARFTLYNNNGQGAELGAGLGNVLNDGNWHHIVAVRDDLIEKNLLYVDGSVVDEASINYQGNFASDVPLNIGWLNLAGGFHYEGNIDEVTLYSRALTTIDVNEHFNSGSSGNDYCSFVPTISTATLPAASVDDAYETTVLAKGVPFPTFSLLQNPSGMSIDASTGQITWTPSAGQIGSHSVEVQVANTEGNATKTFQISVGNFNGAPTFTIGGNQNVSEDSGPTIVMGWATDIDDGDSDEIQVLTFNITGNSNSQLFSSQPSINSDGDLSYTPADNANGTATITITLSDNGSGVSPNENTSEEKSFTIQVSSVNDAPGFSAGSNQVVNEDSGNQVINNWASNISDGDPELNQQLNFQIINSNPSLFSQSPSIDGNGTLSYTPKANAFGSATLTVTLVDNGSASGQNQNSSASAQFTITVNDINDTPTLNEILDPQPIAIGAGEQQISLSGISGGPNENQLILLSATTNTPGLVSNISIDYVSPNTTGTLRFTPSAQNFGDADITVTVTDNGSNILPNVNTSSQAISIKIIETNHDPSFVAGEDIVIDEDTGAITFSNWATNIDDGDPGLSQGLTFNIVGNNNPALLQNAPIVNSSNGNLTIETADNANGTALITLELEDSDGGKSNQISFLITVNSVNDAPSFTIGPNQSVNPDAGIQRIEGWATNIDDGDPELGQTLIFEVLSNSNPSIFAEQPSVNPLGDLTFTPDENVAGTADLSLILRDDGNSDGLNKNESVQVLFSIEVIGPTGFENGVGKINMNLFPNPSTAGSLTIELSNTGVGPYELVIYNLLGKIHEVHNGLISNNKSHTLKLDINELQKGTYLVKFIHSSGIFNSSFIKY